MADNRKKKVNSVNVHDMRNRITCGDLCDGYELCLFDEPGEASHLHVIDKKTCGRKVNAAFDIGGGHYKHNSGARSDELWDKPEVLLHVLGVCEVMNALIEQIRKDKSNDQNKEV